MKSWKTSLFGLIAAVLQAKAGGFSWSAIGSAAPTLLLGLVAKDGDVTGAHPLVPKLAAAGAVAMLVALFFV